MISVQSLSGHGRWALIALGVLFAGVVAAVALWQPAEGATEARAVRQLMTSVVQPESGVEVFRSDTWTLTDENGVPIRFIGFYSDEDGVLKQVQVRSPEGEQVWWKDYQGSPAAPGSCIEEAPPAPHGMVTLPGHTSGEQLLVAGYTLGTGQAPEIPVTPGFLDIDAQPLEVRTYDTESSTLYVQSEEFETGEARSRQLLLAPDGLVAGFWSETYDAAGLLIGANSMATSRVEIYEPAIFAEVLKELPTDESCN